MRILAASGANSPTYVCQFIIYRSLQAVRLKTGESEQHRRAKTAFLLNSAASSVMVDQWQRAEVWRPEEDKELTETGSDGLQVCELN